MINQYAGPCQACAQWVEKGQGEYTKATKTLVHSQCTPVAPVVPVRAFSIDRIYNLESFEQALSEQTDFFEMLRIQAIIKRMNRLETKHPLNHTLDGYKRAFIALNKRGKQLGYAKKNSDGTFYIPSTMVAVNPI